MTNRDGTPIWYELMTDAPDAAQAFYAPVMGWVFDTPPGGMERDYRVFAAPDGEGVGGIMPAAMPPTWAFYVGVADVDAMAGRVTDLGGKVHLGPQDIPGVGRFAFVADPQGATFYLMRGGSDVDSTAFAPSKPGHYSWNELVTSDQDAALVFYGALFGWTVAGAMPMGDMGDYTFLAHQGDMIGAVMTNPQRGSGSFWNFAFTVPDIDRAKAAVEAGGGTVRQGPVALPGDDGDWMIQIIDPQGAKVMLTGKREEGAA